MIDLLPVITYVMDAPYFWMTMGMVSACAVFVGAILYDGILSLAAKGIISTAIYASFIITAHVNRVNYLLSTSPEMRTASERVIYANVVTIGFITLFWMIGIVIGVVTSCLVRKKKGTLCE